MMESCVEPLVGNHPLLPLISILLQVLMSESLRPSLAKRLSYELVKVSPMILFGSKVVDQNQGKQKIDQVVKRTAATLLINFGALLKNLLSADEAFKVLIAANEPFKRTRRRLPPQAEKELADWLVANRSHPYPTDEFIDKFCAKFEGIEEDQVRIFLTNSRRKMTEGVRKRSKSS